MSTITYTQHSVAFPTLTLEHAEVDQLSINDDEGGDMLVTFHRFSGGHRGVRLAAFGDALDLLYDKRLQAVIKRWRKAPDPDAVTPEQYIAWLEEAGAEPSSYHLKGAR